MRVWSVTKSTAFVSLSRVIARCTHRFGWSPLIKGLSVAEPEPRGKVYVPFVDGELTERPAIRHARDILLPAGATGTATAGRRRRNRDEATGRATARGRSVP